MKIYPPGARGRAKTARGDVTLPLASFKQGALRADAALSTTQLANQRLTGAQDLAWAIINNPSFLFNR